MGKKTKQGKGRLDKYYHIAKQQGYRSRACFKLIQINKKYNFLGKANVVIDLCAAPGGWLQVCEKFCPYGAIKIGLDLDKISPIPGCKTFQQDITTPECFTLLKGELKGKKADCVLNDGAPNVGSNWNKDAFQQIELTLSALKLAANFLRPGGNFITKVFRSTDYNALIFVMKKFFKKVEANKPLASRFASAEIFVCCIDFIAPDVVDERLFDPKYIFKDTEADNHIMQITHEINSVDKIMEKRRKRQGYADDAPQMLSRTMEFSEYISCDNPFPTFVTHSKITQPSKEMLAVCDAPKFYDEYLDDLQVLGKREIGSLIKWRGKLRQKIRNKKKEEKGEEEEDEEENEDDIAEDEEEKISGEEDFEDMEEGDEEDDEEEEEDGEGTDSEQEEELRKVQKKELNEQRKKRLKKEKQIAAQGVSVEFQGQMDDEELFTLSQHKSIKKMGYVEVDDDNNDKKVNKIKMTQRDIEDNLENIYENQMAKANKTRQKLLEKKKYEQNEIDQNDLECEPLEKKNKKKKKSEDETFMSDQEEEEQIKKQIQKKQWFDKDVFKGVGGIEDHKQLEDDQDDMENPFKNSQYDAKLLDDEQLSDDTDAHLYEDSDEEIENEDDEEDYEDVDDEDEDEEGDDDDEDDDEFDIGENGDLDEDIYIDQKVMKKRKLDEKNMANIEIDPNEAFPGENPDKEAYKLDLPQTDMEKRRKKLKRQQKKRETKKAKTEEVHELNQPMEIVPETKIEDFNVETLAETLALGKKMLRKRARDEIIDHSYNRYAFEDHDDLPGWFADDEKRHEFKTPPVTKEEVQAEVERIRAINSKAPKKVLEAKIRKQKRLEKKMKRTNKQVTEIFDQEGVSEKMKIVQAKKLYSKSIQQVKGEKKKKAVVGQKFKTGPVNQKSKKESYVDSRMRKDVKNQRGKKGKKGTVQSGNGGAKPSRTHQVKRRKRKTLRA